MGSLRKASGGTEHAAPLASHFFAGGPSLHPKVNARACRTAGAVEVASVVAGSPPLWLSLLLEQPSPQLEATSSALAWSAAQASSSSPRFSGRTASPPPMRVVALQTVLRARYAAEGSGVKCLASLACEAALSAQRGVGTRGWGGQRRLHGEDGRPGGHPNVGSSILRRRQAPRPGAFGSAEGVG